MASDGRTEPRAFPVGLTLAAAVALAVLLGLGVWQVRRLAWKERVIARIAALRAAPPRPIGPLLDAAARGADLDFVRAEVACAPSRGPRPMIYRYALRDGRIGWRVLSACRLAPAPFDGPFDGILLDRGLAERFNGAMSPAPAAFPDPVAATGVLRRVAPPSPLDPATPRIGAGMTVLRVLDAPALALGARQSGLARPAPYVLAVEVERPAPAGIVPAALPGDIPNNHLAYALTWFALAGIAAWFYVALVWRRMTGR